MEGLHEVGLPPFLTKTFQMVEDFRTEQMVSWSKGGHSFVVWDPHSFASNILPTYFNHHNFSSFVRQLNAYGFKKMDSEKWEFANEYFVKGQKQLLKNIRRRKAPSHALIPHQQFTINPAVEIGTFGQDFEMDQLRRDKHILTIELVKLRQQQQEGRAQLQQMELKLQKAEKKQHQMMRFLAKGMRNPDLFHQLVQMKERKECEEDIGIECAESSRTMNEDLGRIKIGPANGFGQVSELEALALEMQGFGRGKRERSERVEEVGSYQEREEVDEGFWEELFSVEFGELMM